jgi:hypothetical protein
VTEPNAINSTPERRGLDGHGRSFADDIPRVVIGRAGQEAEDVFVEVHDAVVIMIKQGVPRVVAIETVGNLVGIWQPVAIG